MRSEEDLEPGIRKIIEGIAELEDAITARVRHEGEWQLGHITQIVGLRNDLTLMYLKLRSFL